MNSCSYVHAKGVDNVAEKVKKEFILDGLSCAHCANLIELESNKVSGINNAKVDFVSSKLILDVSSDTNINTVVGDIKSLVKVIEPEVEVREFDKSSKKNSSNFNIKELAPLILGSFVYLIVSLFNFTPEFEFILYLISYLAIGGEVTLVAGRNILKGRVFDENFLMAVATLGAFAIGEYAEGVAVMLFFQIGELFQDMAVNKSRKSITSLMDIRSDYANIKDGNTFKKVSPEDVQVGNIIIVKPGEKIPLDGTILDGRSSIDTSSLTGESLPREVGIGDEILSGSINKNGLLSVKVTKSFSDSTVSKILDLVQNASSNKSPTENFISKFARYYTPIVVFSSLALAIFPPLLLNDASFSQWTYRALSFLVVSCPCALVISVPLGFFGGIGNASRNGILIKGSNYLEALNNVDTVVFDKTGTLTKGIFKVTSVNPQDGFSKDEILTFAAYAESQSSHPIALSILRAYGKKVDVSIKNYNEISGNGIEVSVDDKNILVGNYNLMASKQIPCDKEQNTGTIIYVAVDNSYAGHIIISDEIKDDSHRAIKTLKKYGVNNTIMLTGDNFSVGKEIADKLNLDRFYTNLLPHEKVEKLEEIYKQRNTKGNLVFVGDGINDAPVLARSDIGIAMGGIGSDAAIEAADVVIMTDEPSKISTAIQIAKKTRKIVTENIVFALGVKILILIVVALGYGTMWEAVFGDVGVALIAVLNSMRALKS